MKYELLKLNTITHYGGTLYRIRALKDFSDVKKGIVGGWVQSEDNLSQEGNCWIYDNAKVYGSAKIYDSVKIYDDAEIYGNTKVYGCSEVSGNSWIYGKTIAVDVKIPRGYVYSKVLIIPKDHPDFWDYRLEYPDLEVVYI